MIFCVIEEAKVKNGVLNEYILLNENWIYAYIGHYTLNIVKSMNS